MEIFEWIKVNIAASLAVAAVVIAVLDLTSRLY